MELKEPPNIYDNTISCVGNPYNGIEREVRDDRYSSLNSSSDLESIQWN
jgi:hypothetical protein